MNQSIGYGTCHCRVCDPGEDPRDYEGYEGEPDEESEWREWQELVALSLPKPLFPTNPEYGPAVLTYQEGEWDEPFIRTNP